MILLAKAPWKLHVLIAISTLFILFAVSVIVITSASISFSQVQAQSTPDWAFLNTMALPWRCGEKDPRESREDWNDHWNTNRADGAAIDFNYSGEGDFGTDVLAPFAGIATAFLQEDEPSPYGNRVIIDAGNGWSVLLAHLSQVHIATYASVPVQRGELVGAAGSTGNSNGTHIHLELLWNEESPDPTWFNTGGHFLFSHPTDDFLTSPGQPSPVPFYSNNCGPGPSTSLYWDAGWNGNSTHYVGYGDFTVPLWFNDQASSLLMIEGESTVTVFEHVLEQDNGGGYRDYNQDDDNFAGDYFHNGKEVNGKVSFLRVSAVPSCAMGSASSSNFGLGLNDCPTPPPPTPPPNGWKVDYFNGQNFDSHTETAYENTGFIDHNWGTGSPGHGVGADNFSIRYERDVYFDQAGQWKFTIKSDDGFRLYIDGNIVAQEWWEHNADVSPTIELAAKTYKIKLEYFEAYGDAKASLRWDYQPPSSAPVANFDAWPQEGALPLSVDFHDISTGDITSCFWDYGDGTTSSTCYSNGSYHQHIYYSPGTYTVSLTVSGPGGTNTQTRTNYIQVYSNTTIPSSPTNVQASDGTYANKVYITWDASPGATYYEVYYTNFSDPMAPLGNTEDTFFDDFTNSDGDFWSYWVKACNEGGCSGFSSSDVGYAAIMPSELGPPTLFTIDNPNGAMSYLVNWHYEHVIDEPLQGYILQEQLPSTGGWNAAYQIDSTSIFGHFSVSGRTEGQWCYRVRAFTASQESDWSNIECTWVSSFRPGYYAYIPGIIK